MHRATRFVICSSLLIAMLAPPAFAQKKGKSKAPVRGSIVEDRAARKMLEAGDARFDSDEQKKAVEIWQSILERYPRSKVRFAAHMRLAKYLLERERAYDQARTHYEVVAGEENGDQEQRAEATLKMGRCFFEAGNYGRCFKVMREVIEKYPVSEQVNRAYYYIGLGHFKLGHYSCAIQALEKVGTTLSNKDKSGEKVEAGKRLFVKIEDADEHADTSFSKTINWGVHLVIDKSENKRALWAASANAPISLLILTNSLILIVWGIIFFICFKFNIHPFINLLLYPTNRKLTRCCN